MNKGTVVFWTRVAPLKSKVLLQDSVVDSISNTLPVDDMSPEKRKFCHLGSCMQSGFRHRRRAQMITFFSLRHRQYRFDARLIVKALLHATTCC